MKLAIYRHLWGIDESWEICFPKIAASNLYVGIESPLPARDQTERWQALLAQHHFRYMAMGFTWGATPAEHLLSMRTQAGHAKELGAVFINFHSGVDLWSIEEGIAFFKEAVKIERDSGLAFHHETHRGRVLFNPRDTRIILEKVPELTLTADFSHWVVVCERMLEDRLNTFALVARHTRHVHARVGYEEGPQVPDPRAPEYHRHIVAHEAWWDLCWDAAKNRGDGETSLTPEFGPVGYMHALPYTNVPVANLWDICDWQAARQRDRFCQRGAATTMAVKR